MFDGVDSGDQGYAPQLKWVCHAEHHWVVLPGQERDGAMARVALEKIYWIDKALRNIECSMLSRLNTLVEMPAAYRVSQKTLEENLLALAKF